MKEKMCYVALDFEQEIDMSSKSSTVDKSHCTYKGLSEIKKNIANSIGSPMPEGGEY
jgi:hypothetical protein